jgi:hypothetical protein
MASQLEHSKIKIAIENVRIFDGVPFGEPSMVNISGGVIGGDSDRVEEVGGREFAPPMVHGHPYSCRE